MRETLKNRARERATSIAIAIVIINVDAVHYMRVCGTIEIG